jgi:hypothetical protein
MKTFLVAVSLIAAAGCTSVKEVQVELIQAQLIKIDTVHRQPNEYRQQLTWRGQDNIEYVSFVSMDQAYPLGVSLLVMKTR